MNLSKPTKLTIQTADLTPNGLPSPTLSALPTSPKRKADALDEEPKPLVFDNTGTTRRCNYCGATQTPMWRHGPANFTNLCNSCGVKWRRGKILNTGENRHHLCKAGNTTQQKKAKTMDSPISPKSPVSPVKAYRKEKDFFPEQRTPKARNAVKKQKQLFTPLQSPVKDDIVNVNIGLSNTFSSNQTYSMPSFVPTLSSSLLMNNNNGVHSPIDSIAFNQFPVISEIPRQQVMTPLQVALTQPMDQMTKMQILTNEFADLLERLPAHRTIEFQTVLAQCFAPKMAYYMKANMDVEMTVLDVTEDCWNTLRSIAC
ncbi:hypothetical protein BC833DRAFT_579464 [Globomyces pollinis-pini]|nr:hypothetical protein BC833DRAFT_579464 [Globomyces pollinis-pini]